MAPLRELQGERGASMVEFALILPVVIALLLGIITGGIAYNQSISLHNAAREAARYGATLPVDPSMAAWLSDVAEVAESAATGDLDDGVAGRKICVAYVYPDGTEPDDRTVSMEVDPGGASSITLGGTCYLDDRPDDERRVQVLVERDGELEAFFFSRSLDLEAQSTTRFERYEP